MDEIFEKIAMVLLIAGAAVVFLALICMIISVAVSTFGGK